MSIVFGSAEAQKIAAEIKAAEKAAREAPDKLAQIEQQIQDARDERDLMQDEIFYIDRQIADLERQRDKLAKAAS